MAPRFLTVYFAAMALLGIAVVAAPSAWGTYLWALISLLSATAIVGGTLVNKPPRRSPWWLLAGAVLAMGCGDVVFGATVHRAGDSPPVIDDLFYMAMFPLVTAALIDLTRSGSVLRDRSRLIELVAFAGSVVLAAWAFLIGPTFGTDTMPWDDKSASAAYNLGDVLILVAATRLLVAARRSPSLVLIAIGAFGGLVGDATYTLDQLRGGWSPGGPAEAAYVLFYFGWGAAALHPSMIELTALAEPMRTPRPRAGWTVLLGFTVAIPPATLLIESLSGQVRDGVFIAAISVVTFALVITRLADALRSHHAATARERGLRLACGELVAAKTPGEVREAMRSGVRTFLPRDVHCDVALRFNDGDQAMDFPLPPSESRRRTRLVPISMLGDDLRQELHSFEYALVCPLIVDQGSARDPGAGGLFVAAAEPALRAMQDSVEVLAAQAALALERIALTDAAMRRDSDEYLRAVVRNTADVVLIIDDDQRIRYASPSLHTILDIELRADSTLRDIVHPDDHDQLTGVFGAATIRPYSEDGTRDVWSLLRSDSTRALVEVSYRDLRHDRLVRGVVVTMHDITHEQEERMEAIRRTLDASPAGQNRRSAARKFK